MALFTKRKASKDASEKVTLGKGVFRRCDGCGETLKAEDFATNLEVCPQCDHHYKLSAEAWVDLLLDPGSFEEHDTELAPTDPLGFVDSKPYAERLVTYAKKSDQRHGMNLAARIVREQGALRKLFEVIGPRYATRNGGYTRVLHLMQRRRGDAAPMSVIEFVDRDGELRVPKPPR